METLNQQVLTDERALTPTVRDVLAIGYRPPKDRSLAPTVRDVVAIGFRHRKLLTISFIAVLLAVFNEKTPDEILAFPIDKLFAELKLPALVPMRSNGLTAMVRRIQTISTLHRGW